MAGRREPNLFSGCDESLWIWTKKKKKGRESFKINLFFYFSFTVFFPFSQTNVFRVKRHICIRASLSIFTRCPMIDVSFQHVHPCYPQGWINHRWAAICRKCTHTYTHTHSQLKHTYRCPHRQGHKWAKSNAYAQYKDSKYVMCSVFECTS